MMIKLWVSLDVPTAEAAEGLMERVAPHKAFKIGLELYHRIGPQGVLKWTQAGFEVFLDAKLHDIPRTVAGAVTNIEALGVELITVHVAGGMGMLEAAQGAAVSSRLIGVTVLTSLGQADLFHLGYHKSLPEMAMDYAKMAKRSGLSGVVVSSAEVAGVARWWPQARLIVPGIRWPGQSSHDQQRIGDPHTVMDDGGTDLVLGRGLWEAPDPHQRLLELTAAATQAANREASAT